MADGVVVLAGWNGGYGKQVQVQHAEPYFTSYAHLSKINVKKGQKVKQGTVIGLVGSTGNSTGPHLHYEMKINKKRVNPMKQKLPYAKVLTKQEQKDYFVYRDLVLQHLNSKKPFADTAP